MSTQPQPLQIRRLSVGPMDNNVYLVVDGPTGEAAIVDASSEAGKILQEASGLHVRYILITHGHHDHTGALEELRRALGAPVAVHAADAPMLPSPSDMTLEDGQVLELGGSGLRVLHTPGHTPGSICLYTDGTLLSGDTLFPGGPGNTRGNREAFEQIITSVREKLFVLPEDTDVLPGHGEPTTIGDEKPFLEDWIARGW